MNVYVKASFGITFDEQCFLSNEYTSYRQGDYWAITWFWTHSEIGSPSEILKMEHRMIYVVELYDLIQHIFQ